MGDLRIKTMSNGEKLYFYDHSWRPTEVHCTHSKLGDAVVGVGPSDAEALQDLVLELNDLAAYIEGNASDTLEVDLRSYGLDRLAVGDVVYYKRDTGTRKCLVYALTQRTVLLKAPNLEALVDLDPSQVTTLVQNGLPRFAEER